MVTMLALMSAVLYGTADFLGGVSARRAHTLAVLAVTAPAGLLLTLVVLVALPGARGHLTWSLVSWAMAAGTVGALGLIAFYSGFAAAPMSVVAPVSALISTVLPVGVALAGGERPSVYVALGAIICVVAVALVSMERSDQERSGRSARLRALMYAVPAGAAFGLYFVFMREAGGSGVGWPVTMGRTAGMLVAFTACAIVRIRPVGWKGSPRVFRLALLSGALDAAANLAYVMATRVGMFGLAVVLTSLYPGVTVLLARCLLGERMRWIQRAGLILAGVGVALVSV